MAQTTDATPAVPREHVDYLFRVGNLAGMNAALDAMLSLDKAELDRQDAHEAWSEAQAELAADQTESAREAF